MNSMNSQPAPVVDDAVTQRDVTEIVRGSAMVVDLKISLWSGERTKRKVADKLRDDNHVSGKIGRYIQNLLAGYDEQLKEVHAAYAQIRAVHYDLTLPWVADPHDDAAERKRNTGPRLLPSVLLAAYLTQKSERQKVARQKLDAFIAVYPDLAKQAQANLGELYNFADYPPAAKVWDAFRVATAYYPVPDPDGFQGLPEHVSKALGGQLRSRQEVAIAAARLDMWGRVHDAVRHMLDRLTSSDTRFKASSTEAVRSLIELLPALNCFGDPQVGLVVADIRTMLDGISAEAIRKDVTLRAHVVAQAQAILDKLPA